jgi:hypothetical protein
MTQLRTENTLKQRAHRLLDEVKAGIYHEPRAITWALAILGEPVNG